MRFNGEYWEMESKATRRLRKLENTVIVLNAFFILLLFMTTIGGIFR